MDLDEQIWAEKCFIWYCSFKEMPQLVFMSISEEIGGNGSKMGILEPFVVKFREGWSIFKFEALFNKPPNSSVGRALNIFPLILAKC